MDFNLREEGNAFKLEAVEEMGLKEGEVDWDGVHLMKAFTPRPKEEHDSNGLLFLILMVAVAFIGFMISKLSS